MHGHDFIILAQGHGEFDHNDLPEAIVNPTRRDVATMAGDGYLVISFPVDNPGFWLLHCHLAWHASQGLALLILEDKKNIKDHINEKVCKDWNNYLRSWKPPPDEMEDSGVKT
ncbi:Laccase-2 [Dactylella cylindrospora]|nr:Laccase-2 [Dactylella cylindrospora]